MTTLPRRIAASPVRAATGAVAQLAVFSGNRLGQALGVLPVGAGTADPPRRGGRPARTAGKRRLVLPAGDGLAGLITQRATRGALTAAAAPATRTSWGARGGSPGNEHLPGHLPVPDVSLAGQAVSSGNGGTYPLIGILNVVSARGAGVPRRGQREDRDAAHTWADEPSFSPD